MVGRSSERANPLRPHIHRNRLEFSGRVGLNLRTQSQSIVKNLSGIVAFLLSALQLCPPPRLLLIPVRPTEVWSLVGTAGHNTLFVPGRLTWAGSLSCFVR